MDDRIPHRDARRSWFDEVAEKTSNITSGAPFFAICIVLVVAWLPTLGVMGSEASQFLIQTITAIVTFLLVALLQNAEKRHQEAINIKLDAIAHGVADLMRERTGEENDLHDNIDRLVHTVGLEGRLSSRKGRTPTRADAK